MWDLIESEKREAITRLLTDPELSGIKAMLEKDHAIDCVFLLMLDKGRWKPAREFMKELKLTLPDGAFRARMKEIEFLGLARSENIDAKKRRWIISDFGKHIGRLLLDLFSRIAGGGQS